MTSIPSVVATLILDLPPSCIAFCPSQPDYFVVGTYYLHAKDNSEHANEVAPGSEEGKNGHEAEQQNRSGSLILYKLDGDTV